jgi:REP element-mobilizing transposase RayT
MSLRKTDFIEGEYYHIYNRGVDKRDIFLEIPDLMRFLQSMKEFNVKDPIGSLYENSFLKDVGGKASKSKLVKFVAYCLNPNHYHFILTPLVEKGIEKFMQRLGTGYVMYFNEKNKRSGAVLLNGNSGTRTRCRRSARQSDNARRCRLQPPTSGLRE